MVYGLTPARADMWGLDFLFHLLLEDGAHQQAPPGWRGQGASVDAHAGAACVPATCADVDATRMRGHEGGDG